MPAGILLLASLLSAPAGGQVADPSPSPSPPPEAVAPGTLISSTRTSNTYAAEDGARTTVLFPASVNFKDQGEFVPIDNDLVPVPGTEPGVENEANRYTVRLPDELDSQVRIDRPSGTVGLELVGAAPVQGIVSGDTMSYPDVLPGVTLRYTAANDQVKETIELASPTSPSSLAFRLTPGPGLTPSPNPAGGVDLTDGDGVVVYSILPPWAVDSDHPAWEDPGQVTMALSEDPGGYLLTMTPDPAWLQDPAREWPVLIDPTITIGPPLQDCFVSAGSNQNTSLCAYTQVNVGDNSNGVRRGLVRFDLSAVPVGADISQATLKLYMSSQSNTRASAASLHRATRAWTNAATWNSWDGTSPWTTPGGDFDAVPAASNPQVGDALGWVTWQPTQLVRDWASGAAPNDGVLVKTATEDVGNLMSFTSTDSTDSVHWPVLKVTYTQAAPAPK
ncbi:MAG: DNRLRE domain-containing protein, partial [Actinobacteria bacterium]|nr:DNRLRE domain-containing protein [Actinomycetota bacterium]